MYSNKEIDAVVELEDGRWGAFEIKLGANQMDGAATSLLDLKTSFEEDEKGRTPAILGIIRGLSNTAYRRDDGVFVIPPTALRA